MLSTIRRALTPTATHAEDNHVADLTSDASPAAQTSFLRDSSPLQLAQEKITLWTAQASNAKDPKMTAHHDPSMPIPSDQSLPDRGQDETDDSLLGPVRNGEFTSESHHGAFSLDGPSDDHLPPSSPDAHAGGSLLPSVEPAPPTEKSHRKQRTPTPGANHVSVGPTTSSPQQPSDGIIENRLPSAEPVQSTSKSPPAQQILEIHVGPESKTSNTSQPSKMVTKTSGGLLPRRRKAGRAETTQEAAKVGSSPTSTGTPKRGRPKKAASPNPTGQSSAPKKRGRPPKATQPAAAAAPTSASTADEPKKRGRPKKADEATQDATKPAAAATPNSAPTADKSKKRGRPKKSDEATQDTEPQAAPAAHTRKKRRNAKSEDAAEASEPQGPSDGDADGERGGQDETMATPAPAKRGRPKKKQAAYKGAKPTGISKKKAGRK